MESFKIDKRDVTFHGAGPCANPDAGPCASCGWGTLARSRAQSPYEALRFSLKSPCGSRSASEAIAIKETLGPSGEGIAVVLPNFGAFFRSPGAPEAIGATGDPQNWRLRGGPKHGTLSLT
jgi:hypothetical protein